MSIRRSLAALAGALLLVAGCRREDASVQKLKQEPEPAAVGSTFHAPSPPAMQIGVTDVQGDPSVDIDGVRVVLGDAEGAFLSCLDPGGSTGVIALRIPIERDGAAGDIGVRNTTTYGSDEARSCFTRIVAAMRFPHPSGASEVLVTLEVSSRSL